MTAVKHKPKLKMIQGGQPHVGTKAHVARDSQRPFRLWDTERRQNKRWAYYGTARAAEWGALREVAYSPVGEVLEVYDARTMKFIASFKRGVSSVIIQRD